MWQGARGPYSEIKGDKMLSTYKEKILKELEEVPGEMMPKLYKIIHLLTTELIQKKDEKENDKNENPAE